MAETMSCHEKNTGQEESSSEGEEGEREKAEESSGESSWSESEATSEPEALISLRHYHPDPCLFLHCILCRGGRDLC